MSLRVLHVITRLVHGGAQRNTLMCAAHQARRGHRVTVVTGPETGPEGSLLEEAARAPYRLIVLPDLVRDPHPVKDLRALRALDRLLAREPQDVIHTHTSKAGLLGRWVAWRRGAPAIVHTPHGHVFHGYFPPLKTRLYAAMERASARVSHRLIMLTEGCLRDHLAERIAPPERFVIIPSGVDLGRFTHPEAAPPPFPAGGGPVIGCVARLVEVKGLLDLVAAMAEVRLTHPGARLVLVGDGPLRPQLERRIRELDLDARVHLTGRIDDVAPLLPHLQLFVLPSHNEGMGRAVVEAMAAGLPVIATEVGGLPDVIVQGETGLLVPPRAPGPLAEAIRALLDQPERAREMGQAGRIRARRFSDERMYELLEQVYQEVLAERGRAPIC